MKTKSDNGLLMLLCLAFAAGFVIGFLMRGYWAS